MSSRKYRCLWSATSKAFGPGVCMTELLIEDGVIDNGGRES
jgi:hypothetical protein